ncbi:hydrogenase expression/formation protein HypE [Clostridium gasigenes]|uniref:hydrogenase expression/formation protein HypE n=1 Tax=Clostridium gasigenes TaxID=94869 RepID=UPI001C0D4FCF|nr:hydrogenase expression/formation protein HypE [Clostridium gasigenes]MBU3109517.1 hydrogenase expression/formation protein HypE [Clostridium gasigenes]
MAHGSGGEESYKLIEEVFYNNFNNEELLQQNDSTIVDEIKGKIAITTDSFVIDPIFFPGGDIGKLSVCGTINDLAVSGAKPLYITAAFIIEEGFQIESLKKIVKSMADTAKEAGVKIVAGDTKVVEKGRGDKIYINTTGIGEFTKERYELNMENIRIGDKIILSGTMGDHGMCIMNEREKLDIESSIKSDCATLNTLTADIMSVSKEIKIMRDPTRGGVAGTLNELVNSSGKSMMIYEKDLPINEEVTSFCEILGIDPLYVANEGKLICIVSSCDAEKVINVIRAHSLGMDAEIIGEVVPGQRKALYIKTELGAMKIVPMPQGELLPRIC